MQKAVELVANGKILRGMYHTPELALKMPMMILFHGFTGLKSESHRIFLKLSRLLEEQGIAVLRFDFSGSGESDGDFAEMTFSSEVGEAGAILDYASSLPEIDTSRIGILGLSMGGAVAAILAGRRPAEIKLLVLWAPATAKHMREILTTRFDAVFQDERGCYDLDGYWLNAGFIEDLGHWDSLTSVSNFKRETLIIQGSDDTVVPVAVARQYQKTLSETARLEIIQGAGHTFDRFDWEAAVLRKTVDFLASKL